MSTTEQQKQDSKRDVDFAAQAPLKKSWGEKYGTGMFGFLRDWVINYFINFTIGATVAYKWDTSRPGKGLMTWIEKTSEKSTMVSPSVAKYVLRLVTRNQFLLMGGHALLPFLKVMKDNQQQLTFGIGHTLDQLQGALGQGDEASTRALAEYDRAKQLLESKKTGGAVQLTDDDKAMLARHQINEQLQFNETKQSWWSVIIARLIGMTCSTAASGGLGWLSGQNHVGFLKYKPRYEEPFGRWTADKIVTKTPVLRSFFKEQPTLIGEYFLADAILTSVSAGVYNNVENAILKKDAEKQKKDKDKPGKTVSVVTQQGVAANPALTQLDHS